MYINFWYPICTSDELQAEPLRADVFGLRFVAFRDSDDNPHVLSDTCVHRGGSLSKGRVQDGRIVCPYHGWQYDGSGACRSIPSQQKGKPPGRAKIDAYPVDERYGLVFAFLGDLPEQQRPPLYEIPEWGQQGWRPSLPIVMDINCYYERSVENGLDPLHNEFVHPSQGLPKMRQDTVTREDLPYGTKFMAHYGELDGKPTDLSDLRSDPDQLRAGSWYHGPNVLVTQICFDATREFIQYGFETPLGENRTRVYLVNTRNCMLEPELDEKVRKINFNVAMEDVTILENLRPVRTPDTNTREILTSGDEFVVCYRKHLKEWDARGWRIDAKQLRNNDGDVAYAVPSPDRRKSGNWVLDPVPTIEPQAS